MRYPLASEFCSFVNASPTPFHAVESSVKLLTKAGYRELNERESFRDTVQPGGKYYITRNGSTLIAFAVGKKWLPGNGVAMIGAHTDSPVIKMKPFSRKSSEGYAQIGVETYGGGLFHTWFDRDLSGAGRVMVRQSNGTIKHALFNLQKPFFRIPTLAIHLDREANTKFEYNRENQLLPIAALEKEVNTPEPAVRTGDAVSIPPSTTRHHAAIVNLISENVKASPEDIVDFDCILYDTQPAVLGGLHEEFVFSARLDNLMMSFCSIKGLIESTKRPLDEESTIRLVSLFDHEEIGSLSAQGADSNFLPSVLGRLDALPFGESASTSLSQYDEMLSKSLLISADMAHAVHPNYAGKYEAQHKPGISQGTVIKINANAKYATSSPGIAFISEVAKKAQVPLQRNFISIFLFLTMLVFVVRNDSSCGGTIGSMLSAKLGTRTVDLGNAQLSMHSIRETGGSADVEYAVELFDAFFANFTAVEGNILVDARANLASA